MIRGRNELQLVICIEGETFLFDLKKPLFSGFFVTKKT